MIVYFSGLLRRYTPRSDKKELSLRGNTPSVIARQLVAEAIYTIKWIPSSPNGFSE